MARDDDLVALFCARGGRDGRRPRPRGRRTDQKRQRGRGEVRPRAVVRLPADQRRRRVPARFVDADRRRDLRGSPAARRRTLVFRNTRAAAARGRKDHAPSRSLLAAPDAPSKRWFPPRKGASHAAAADSQTTPEPARPSTCAPGSTPRTKNVHPGARTRGGEETRRPARAKATSSVSARPSRPGAARRGRRGRAPRSAPRRRRPRRRPRRARARKTRRRARSLRAIRGRRRSSRPAAAADWPAAADDWPARRASRPRPAPRRDA